MKRPLSKLVVLSFLISAPTVSFPVDVLSEGNVDQELTPPSFAHESTLFEWCENDVAFTLYNFNEGSGTEIWRSRQQDSGFTLVAVNNDGWFATFHDTGLSSFTTYYYKMRAVTPTDTSSFSEIEEFTTGAEWFDPVLELTLLPDNTVQGTLTDRTYLDGGYDITRTDTEFYTTAVMPDSGQVFIFVDTLVESGVTYTYVIDGFSQCRGEVFREVVTRSITIPESGTVGDLEVPTFDFQSPPTYKPCGNEIVFSYDNSNEGAGTEIWRSRSADSGFELAALKHNEGVFIDQNLGSNKTYYYKLRAVKDNVVSEFSDVAGFESGASWFKPTLALTLLDDHTVEGTITDHSYLEYNYQLSFRMPDNTVEELYDNIMLSDSGQTFTFTHASLEPGKTYIYSVDATLGWSCGSRLYANVAVDTITIPDGVEGELLTPAFIDVGPGIEACGNELVFVFGNRNVGIHTEIWRSRNPDSGFELVDVLKSAGTYLDDSLGSRKDYYYKLRAVTAMDTSAFSETMKFTSGAEWFEATLELTVLPDKSVQGTLTDHSYLDDSYEVYGLQGFYSPAVLPDSGGVHTFVDTLVLPGETYTYHVDLYYCNANIRRDIIVKSITIPADDGTELIAPVFISEHPGFEACGNQIAFAFENLNEGSQTEIWRSRDPSSGYELIATAAAGAGGYLDENLESRKAYFYRLRAVTETDTSAFSSNESLESGAKWFEPKLELTLLPDHTVQGKLFDRSYLDAGYEVSSGVSPDGFFVSTSMSDSGRVFTFIDSSVVAGETYTYGVNAILVMTCESRVISNVTDSTITIPDSAPEAAFTVTVFPNPVSDRAQVHIIGPPNEHARITLIDSQGKTHLSTMESLTGSGRFSGLVDLHDLKSGLYYMHIRLKDRSFSETVMITD